MSFVSNDFFYHSSNGKSRIQGRFWLDDSQKPRCILEIVHDLSDYSLRYEEAARFFAENGCVVCAHDMAGHGSSRESGEAGDLGDYRSLRSLLQDMRTLNVRVRRLFPGLPLILLGQGFGSLLCRLYIKKLGIELGGVILCGTPAPGAYRVSLAKCNLLNLLHPASYRSNSLYRAMTSHFNRQFGTPHTRFDWLSRDRAEVARIASDKLCNFVPTIGSIQAATHLLQDVSSNKYVLGIPESLPILLLAGKMDPLSQYHNGTTVLYDRLRKMDPPRNVTLHLYENTRHDLLHEVNRTDVLADILVWLENNEIKTTDGRQMDWAL